MNTLLMNDILLHVYRLESYTATSNQTTKETIQQSQEILKQMENVPLDNRRFMEELNDMSLGIADPEFNFVDHNKE